MTEQNGKKQERNLEEEAHQLGLSSWDRVDKWLKELEYQNQNQKRIAKEYSNESTESFEG